MKKLLDTTILMLALLMPTFATAHDFKVNGIYFIINGTTALIDQLLTNDK